MLGSNNRSKRVYFELETNSKFRTRKSDRIKREEIQDRKFFLDIDKKGHKQNYFIYIFLFLVTEISL